MAVGKIWQTSSQYVLLRTFSVTKILVAPEVLHIRYTFCYGSAETEEFLRVAVRVVLDLDDTSRMSGHDVVS